jgi:hypothetical protein
MSNTLWIGGQMILRAGVIVVSESKILPLPVTELPFVQFAANHFIMAACTSE